MQYYRALKAEIKLLKQINIGALPMGKGIQSSVFPPFFLFNRQNLIVY